METARMWAVKLDSTGQHRVPDDHEGKWVSVIELEPVDELVSAARDAVNTAIRGLWNIDLITDVRIDRLREALKAFPYEEE